MPLLYAFFAQQETEEHSSRSRKPKTTAAVYLSLPGGWRGTRE
jgi:hypothetical protein